MGIWNIFRKKTRRANEYSKIYKTMTLALIDRIDAELIKIAAEKYPNLKSKTIDVSSTIIKQAIHVGASLRLAIPKHFSKEASVVDVFTELVSFLINMTSRIIHKEFGPPSEQILLDNIVPLINEFTSQASHSKPNMRELF